MLTKKCQYLYAHMCQISWRHILSSTTSRLVSWLCVEPFPVQQQWGKIIPLSMHGCKLFYSSTLALLCFSQPLVHHLDSLHRMLSKPVKLFHPVSLYLMLMLYLFLPTQSTPWATMRTRAISGPNHIFKLGLYCSEELQVRPSTSPIFLLMCHNSTLQ